MDSPMGSIDFPPLKGDRFVGTAKAKRKGVELLVDVSDVGKLIIDYDPAVELLIGRKTKAAARTRFRIALRFHNVEPTEDLRNGRDRISAAPDLSLRSVPVVGRVHEDTTTGPIHQIG
jgi:hypothetical protein